MNNGFLDQYWRVGGACGILFIVMFVIGAILQGGEPAAYDDPIEEIRAFWVDDGDSYLLGDYVIGLGFIIFFVPFLSAVRSVLGAAEGESQMFSRSFFAGAILFIALAAAAGSFWTTLAWGNVAENASDETIQTLMWLDLAANHFVPAGIAIMLLPAAFVLLRTRVLPLWLGVVTLLIGVVAVLSMLSIFGDSSDDDYGWVGFPLTGIWVLATSIVLILRKDAPGTASSA